MILGGSFGATMQAALRGLNNVTTQLNLSAVRLATGLAINRASEDPAGVIHSQRLRANIAALEAESSALQRTEGAAAYADAALGEVSDLLVEASGLSGSTGQ